MGYLRWLVPITVLYIFLTGNFELANWVLGFVLAGGVVILVKPTPAPIDWRYLPKAIVATVRFVALLLWDLVESGVQVARLILQPNPKIRQGIVAIPDATETDWITTLSAEAITLTPGELVVEIGADGTLYTHTLNVRETLENSFDAQEIRAEQLEEIHL